MTPTACSVMPRARVRRAARAAPTGGAAARAEFTGPKGSTGKAIWEAWLTLWLLRHTLGAQGVGESAGCQAEGCKGQAMGTQAAVGARRRGKRRVERRC